MLLPRRLQGCSRLGRQEVEQEDDCGLIGVSVIAAAAAVVVVVAAAAAVAGEQGPRRGQAQGEEGEEVAAQSRRRGRQAVGTPISVGSMEMIHGGRWKDEMTRDGFDETAAMTREGKDGIMLSEQRAGRRIALVCHGQAIDHLPLSLTCWRMASTSSSTPYSSKSDRTEPTTSSMIVRYTPGCPWQLGNGKHGGL